jgi:phosphoribosyl 1,2-cyclic phosphate phosphodiesterase
MQVTFTGTGAAGGVPRYGCQCLACLRATEDARWVRRPSSALIENSDTRVLLDAGLMDLHERFVPGSLDAIVLTHYHPDHVQGLFHLRWGVGEKLPVYGPPDSEGCADLYKHPGLLEFIIVKKFCEFSVGSLKFTALPLIHSKVTQGYAIESADGARFAYLTDTCGLPPATLDFLINWKPQGLAIDTTDPPRDSQAVGKANHNDWTGSHALIETIAPEAAWLTHIGHRCDEWIMGQGNLQTRKISVAQDGLQVCIPKGC